MTRVALVEEGRGVNHPEVIGVEALLAKCEDKTPSPDACRLVTNQLTESLSTGYGPNHPKVRALRAKQTLCPK